MTLTVGTKIVYPCYGPCLVRAVVEITISSELKSFYRLTVLNDRSDEFFVPVDNVRAIGVRQLTEKSDIPKLLGLLMAATKVAAHWKQRANDILRLFTSGSAFDLAQIVGSLTEFSKKKRLTVNESRILERAKKLLVSEISEVMSETRTATEKQVNHALSVRRLDVVSMESNYQPVG